MAGIPYAPGGVVDSFMEAYAWSQDFFNLWYHYDLNGFQIPRTGFAAAFGEALSVLNLALATPFVAASLLERSSTEGLLLRK